MKLTLSNGDQFQIAKTKRISAAKIYAAQDTFDKIYYAPTAGEFVIMGIKGGSLSICRMKALETGYPPKAIRDLPQSFFDAGERLNPC